MKKLLSVFGLLFFLFILIKRLAFDLMPTLTSNETAAYKAGFVFAIFLILLTVLGFGYWTYQLFFAQESNEPKALA